MHHSSDPTPHLVTAIRALSSALESLTAPTQPLSRRDSIHQDSGERVEEIDLLLDLLKRALRR